MPRPAFRWIAVLLAAFAFAPVHAGDAAPAPGQTGAQTIPDMATLMPPRAAVPAPSKPQRVATLVVYGNDPCPRGNGDDIVVCARQPESERYRLPKRFRHKPPTVADGSWTSKVEDLESASRANLPDSCSPIGSNGQSGCYRQFLAEARAQRKADKAEAAADTP